MKTFSILTVSKRQGWEDMALRSIHSQDMHDRNYKLDKWVVVTENKLQLPKNSDWIEVVKAPKKIRVSNLNASLNEGLRHITSDYVIFYQDFIELTPDCFTKLLDLAKPDVFVTTCTPNYDGSDDSRYTGCDGVRGCAPREWEANVAIAPMGIIRELGGFDEEYDDGWAWDNLNLAHRAFLLDCKFIIDETNRPKLYPHEMSSHQTLQPNGDRHAQTMDDIRLGKKPLRLSYLDGKR